MGIASTPNFYEYEPAIADMARAELLVNLASERARIAGDGVSTELVANPGLDAMLCKLNECDPGIDWSMYAHMRRMVTLWIGRHIDVIYEANSDVDFYRTLFQELRTELDELASFEADLSDFPGLWDIAHQDLLDYENGSN